jgi:alkylation response protein AidB-like acyl-CoA dehydrogenase
MQFEPTEDQEMLADTLTRFVADTVTPHATAWSQAAKTPLEALHGLRDLGLWGLELPESDGGLALSLIVHSVGASVLAQAGDAYAGLVQDLAGGEAFASVAWVDSQANPLEIREDADTLVLNGIKEAVANAEHANWILVRAKLGEEEGMALVAGDAKGLSLQAQTHGLGLRSTGFANAEFGGVTISKSAWLGASAFKGAQVHLDLGMAALAVGLGAASVGEGARYGMERKQFGKPIAMFQANQFKLADMVTENDGARLLVLRAALSRKPREVDMARVFAVESAFRAADHALQLHGGYGYTEEFAVERFYRDAQFTTALFRTGDMIRSEIANQLLGEV